MKSEVLQSAIELLNYKEFDVIIELLPSVLKTLSHEEKLELLSDLLCDEWYTISHQEFIRSILSIFGKSL